MSVAENDLTRKQTAGCCKAPGRSQIRLRRIDAYFVTWPRISPAGLAAVWTLM
jgi:hypothetical protein